MQPAPPPRTLDDPRGLLAQVTEKLGIGVLVEEVADGPPVRVTASLTASGLWTRVTVEGDTDQEAVVALVQAAVEWARSNTVSVISNWWGGA